MKLQNIWGSNPHENYFRHKIVLDKEFINAVVRIFVDTGYELFINGRLVAHVDEWANTRDYDVLPFLHGGENLIAVHGINHSGHRGLALELAIDGKSVLVSNGTWRVFPEERWGWMLPNFDDSCWKSATVMDMSCAGLPQWSSLPGSEPNKVIPTLDGSPFFQGEIPKCVESPFFTTVRHDWQPTIETTEIAGSKYNEFATQVLPQVIKSDKILFCRDCNFEDEKIIFSSTGRYAGASFVIDFGCEIVGFCRMRIKSKQAVSFRIFYGESIDEAITEPSRDQLLHRMLVEEYRLRGGIQEFESRMRVGFRFARVEFFDCEAPVEVDGFDLRTSFYPVAFKGYFECNDELLNRIWLAGHKTLHLCMQEYYLDAVKRDRFLWVGDARNEALYNYYLFGDTELFEFCWDEIAKCQYPDGAIPSAYGQGLSIILDYVAWYVIAFYDYYIHTGKKEFLLKHRETIKKAANFLISKAGNDGLIDVPQNPLDVWMVTLNNVSVVDSLLNWLYLRVLQTVIISEELANDEISVTKYREIAAAITPKVKKLLLKKPLEATEANLRNSTSMTEIVEQKFRIGEAIVALDMIRQRWGEMLACGADTLYEGFYCRDYPSVTDRDEDAHVTFFSYCHGWTGGATLLMMSKVAGIRPLTPGFKSFVVAPQLGDLTEIRTVVPTPYGEIAFKISVGGDNIECLLLIPAGTRAKFEYGNIKQDYSDGLHRIVIEK